MAGEMMEYDGLVGRFFFKRILQKAVEISEIGLNETVLDFGCERQELKKFLPKSADYVGFDIEERFSDIAAIEGLKDVDTVFALNVLEHLQSEQELERVLKVFKNIGAKKLIVALPRNDIISQLLKLPTKYDATTFFYHLLDSRQIVRVISKVWGRQQQAVRVNLIQYLARY